MGSCSQADIWVRRGDDIVKHPDDIANQLLTAKDLAEMLRLQQKAVYDLPIPSILITKRRRRWVKKDVLRFLSERMEK